MFWSTLIDADELRSLPVNADWAIVDCRFDLADPGYGRRAWQRGHIPGAVFADLERDLSGPVQPQSGRHPLPDPDALVAWLERHGIGNDTQVVAYDDSSGAMAARLWWLMRWLGHDAVAVLDGGLTAWRALGGDITDEPFRPEARRYHAQPGSMPVVNTAALAADLEGVCVVDARTAERYRGDAEPIDAVAGHIPGAVSRPFAANLDADGRLLVPASLRAQWAPIMERARGRTVVATCGSGVSACHHILALAHAELTTAALNPGSWSEWIQDPTRPVAVGDGADGA